MRDPHRKAVVAVAAGIVAALATLSLTRHASEWNTVCAPPADPVPPLAVNVVDVVAAAFCASGASEQVATVH